MDEALLRVLSAKVLEGACVVLSKKEAEEACAGCLGELKQARGKFRYRQTELIPKVVLAARFVRPLYLGGQTQVLDAAIAAAEQGKPCLQERDAARKLARDEGRGVIPSAVGYLAWVYGVVGGMVMGALCIIFSWVLFLLFGLHPQDLVAVIVIMAAFTFLLFLPRARSFGAGFFARRYLRQRPEAGASMFATLAAAEAATVVSVPSQKFTEQVGRVIFLAATAVALTDRSQLCNLIAALRADTEAETRKLDDNFTPIAALDQAIQQNPTDVDNYIKKSHELMELKRYQEMLEATEQAIHLVLRQPSCDG